MKSIMAMTGSQVFFKGSSWILRAADEFPVNQMLQHGLIQFLLLTVNRLELYYYCTEEISLNVIKNHKVEVRRYVRCSKSASFQMWVNSLAFLKLC